jgi:uncharacterized protein (UPF0276 family)
MAAAEQHGLRADAVGLMLKDEFVGDLLEAPQPLDVLELHAENLMVSGGPVLRRLERLRERHAISLHGVGASLGGEDALDEAHLDRLVALVDRFEPVLVSEHLAWSAAGGVCFPDLLPLPWTSATLAQTCRRVDRLQARLKRRVLVESPATYLGFEASTWDEASFICELVRRTGCGLLLDVNNVFVSAANNDRDPRADLGALPLHAVGEIHLAGHTPDDGVLIDSHDAPVADAVWSLYEFALACCGPVTTVIERDADVPPLVVLLREVERARAALRAAVWARAA